MHFLCTFFFTALSTNFVYFVALQTDTLESAQGGGARQRLVARRARDIQFGFWVEIQQKNKKKRDENCKRGTFKYARILLNLTVCVCVCVCTKVQAPLEKSKRTTRDRNGRKAVSLSKSTSPASRRNSSVNRVHSPANVVDFWNGRCALKKAKADDVGSDNVVENVQKICSKMLSKRDAS